MNNVGIVILAAGNSSRLGRPKQLLPYQGKTLLTHIITEAVAAGLYPLVIVTGAFAKEVNAALKDEPVTLVHNPNWQQGMGSGIAVGISYLATFSTDLDAVILSVCDQPHISAALFRNMMDKRIDTGKDIIACTYLDTIGTPVLFSRCYFQHLSMLSGNEGAKKFLKQFEEDLAIVPFPKGAIDIDTEEDYRLVC